MNLPFTGHDWRLRHRDFHLLMGHREPPQLRLSPPNPNQEDLTAEDSASQLSRGTQYSDIFQNNPLYIREYQSDNSTMPSINNHKLAMVAFVVHAVILGIVSIIIAAMFFTCVE